MFQNTKLFAMDSRVYPIDEKNVAPSMVLHIRQIQEMMNENKQITFDISINSHNNNEVNDHSIQNGPKHKRQKITWIDNSDY